MHQFVVLYHEMPDTSQRASHFDLMLEFNGVLRTWAMDKCPVDGETVNSIRLPDHRLEYLSLTGALSENRGCISRWDWGTFTSEQSVAPKEDEPFCVMLEGQRIVGRLRVEPASGDTWSISFFALGGSK